MPKVSRHAELRSIDVLATAAVLIGIACVSRPISGSADPSPTLNAATAVPFPDTLVREGDLWEIPKFLRGDSPRYPIDMRELGRCGRVLVAFVVDTLGRVEGKTVHIVSATDVAFAAPVLQVVPTMVFRPARLNQRATPALVRQWITFDILSRQGTRASSADWSCRPA